MARVDELQSAELIAVIDVQGVKPRRGGRDEPLQTTDRPGSYSQRVRIEKCDEKYTKNEETK